MKSPLTAVILAGGLARRMNGKDKGLQFLQQKPLYQHIWQRLIPQVDQILINANRSVTTYQQSGLSVISDRTDLNIPEYSGPLSGMLTGLLHAKYDWVLFVPCDSPFFQLNLAEKLHQALHNENSGNHHCKAAYVIAQHKAHPTFCLLHRSLTPALINYLQQGQRRVLQFMHQQQAIAVDFSEQHQAFININTLEQLVEYDRLKLEQTQCNGIKLEQQ